MISAQEQASRDYPSIEFVAGHRLHLYRDRAWWCVWLNTEVGDFDGICIAMKHTRQEALAQAVRVLEAAVEQLQRPPEAWASR